MKQSEGKAGDFEKAWLGRRGYWTPERCVQALCDFIHRTGYRPTSAEMNTANGLPSFITFQRVMGLSMSQYCQEQGYCLKEPAMPCGRKPVWSKESIIQATDQFFREHGRYPRAEEYNIHCGLPTHNTIRAHFGVTASEYWEQRYPLSTPRVTRWTREKILEAVQEFIDRNNRLPKSWELTPKNGLPTFYTLLSQTDTQGYLQFQKRFFPMFPAGRAIQWTRERCIQAVEQFVRAHGYTPKYFEYGARNGLPTPATFKRQTGQAPIAYSKEHFPDIPCSRKEPKLEEEQPEGPGMRMKGW